MRKRRAFTLVELLVVIGIIGLLMSILLPTLGRVREQAKVTACMSNLRQVGVAQQGYLVDSRGRLPNKGIKTPSGFANSQFSWVGKTGAPGTGYDWMTADVRPLNQYIGVSDPAAGVPVARCPSDDASRNAAAMSSYDYYGTSYAQNQATENTADVNYKFTLLEPNDAKDAGLRVTALRDATRVVSVAELGAFHEGWTFAQPTVVIQRWHANTPRFNLLFADGHVGAHEVRREHKGATSEYTFYWNK